MRYVSYTRSVLYSNQGQDWFFVIHITLYANAVPLAGCLKPPDEFDDAFGFHHFRLLSITIPGTEFLYKDPETASVSGLVAATTLGYIYWRHVVSLLPPR